MITGYVGASTSADKQEERIKKWFNGHSNRRQAKAMILEVSVSMQIPRWVFPGVVVFALRSCFMAGRKTDQGLWIHLRDTSISNRAIS
jgi:hypothetical protein